MHIFILGESICYADSSELKNVLLILQLQLQNILPILSELYKLQISLLCNINRFPLNMILPLSVFAYGCFSCFTFKTWVPTCVAQVV